MSIINNEKDVIFFIGVIAYIVFINLLLILFKFKNNQEIKKF